VDLLVSSELLETVRQAGAGFSHRDRTWVISSTARALTVAEKMALGDGRADSTALIAALRRHARGLDLLDLNALAREAGTAISAVLLGAIAASGVLPLPRSAYEEAIRAAGKGVQASLAGFALAFETLSARRTQQRDAQALISSVSMPAAQAAQTPQTARTAQTAQTAPVTKPLLDAAALRKLARERVAAYQDEAYARLFDERLARLAAAEGAGAAQRDRLTPIADEATRWLALWMCFDDIVHVAALKLAAGRVARVRREVGAAPQDIVKTHDHFKPGVPELAGLLPQGLAARLVSWDRARIAAGREPWALPMKLATHSVTGTLALRLAAALKGQRRRGHRFALEQALIERWLAAAERGAREHAPLGLELARCGALIKGYGSTNERGKENLLHIIDHLAFDAGTASEGRSAASRSPEGRAQAVRSARLAAVADDSGRALDDALVTHGAPPRAPREQVVRWFKRRPAAPVAASH
jgi:indolepyruvate ferredoxin oxidoreductase beta subunit